MPRMDVIEASPQTAQTASAPGALSIENGIAWLRLDDPGKKVNTLSTRPFEGFKPQAAPPARGGAAAQAPGARPPHAAAGPRADGAAARPALPDRRRDPRRLPGGWPG